MAPIIRFIGFNGIQIRGDINKGDNEDCCVGLYETTSHPQEGGGAKEPDTQTLRTRRRGGSTHSNTDYISVSSVTASKGGAVHPFCVFCHEPTFIPQNTDGAPAVHKHRTTREPPSFEVGNQHGDVQLLCCGEFRAEWKAHR